MSFVPEPHNEDEELRARADGRFGPVDCFQWPQLFCKEYEYAICIRRSDYHPSPDPLSWAWYRPSLEDFEPLPHATSLVGRLKQDKAAGVASLHQIAVARYDEWKKSRGDKKDIVIRLLKALGHDLMVLLNHPLTFHDVVVFVAQAQRYFLDIIAFLDYVKYVLPHVAYPPSAPLSVRTDWMGCFTSDTKVCDELFHAGVPVWLIRCNFTITARTIIEKPVRFTFPDDIIRSMYSEGGKPARPFDPLYRGPGGFLRHLHTRRHYKVTVEQPSVLGPQASSSRTQASSHLGKIPTRAQTRRATQKERARPKPSGSAGGRDKWKEVRMPEMPTPLPIWENAMKRVDKDPSRLKKDMVDRGYRVPEPAILISGQTPERRQLFMTNWLAIRPLWISRLDHDPPVQFPTSQLWREILHKAPSKEELEAAPESCMGNKTAKGRKLAVLEIFGDVAPAMVQGSSFAPTKTVEWRGKEILIASLTNPPPRLIRAILWEIYEIGWRYELCALDQALNPSLWAEHRTERVSFMHAIFPGSSGLVLWSEPLPSKAGDLGLTDSFADNVRVLRSLCVLLSTWLGAHPSFSYIPSFDGQFKQAQVYETMSRACEFYVQTFFDHFGHPPLLPHHFPLEYHEQHHVV
ncbi:hypothetical protein J3R83DRAFT_13979 [Lanmaoa asiatica]|nr:hypothetical protein J3R83DRAFT_13979 [Lanmaoa asiatica]